MAIKKDLDDAGWDIGNKLAKPFHKCMYIHFIEFEYGNQKVTALINAEQI